MLGWYAMPGATRSLTLFAGTRHQVPMIEVFFGGWQTIGIASLCYVRAMTRSGLHLGGSQRPTSFALRESRLAPSSGFFAIVGALNLVSK